MSSNMDSTKIYSKCSSDFDIIPTATEVCVTSSDTTLSDKTLSDKTLSDKTLSDKTLSDTPSDKTLIDTPSDNTTSDTTNTITSDTPVDTTPTNTTTSDDTTTNTITSDTTTSDTTPSDTTPSDTKTSDDTPSDDLNSQSDLHLQNNTFNFIKDSDVYIVSVDGCPKFYVNTEKAAYDKMWEVTRLLSSKYVFDGYRTQYIKVKNNELHILGSYRFFIVAYDQILNRITYNKIYQCL